jgi:hypothetical protein
MDGDKGSSDSQAEILTSSGCLMKTTARLRGILLQEIRCAVAEGNSECQGSSGRDQRLTYAPDTDRQRLLGIQGSVPCRFASYPW